jgi:hypothetical protein
VKNVNPEGLQVVVLVVVEEVVDVVGGQVVEEVVVVVLIGGAGKILLSLPLQLPEQLAVNLFTCEAI